MDEKQRRRAARTMATPMRLFRTPTHRYARRTIRAAIAQDSLSTSAPNGAFPTRRAALQPAQEPVSGSRIFVRRYASPRTATRMSVADLLAVSKQFRNKQTHYILQDQPLSDAVKYLAKNENSATLVVVNEKHQVVGMLTNHIVLERLAKMKGSTPAEWNTKVLLDRMLYPDYAIKANAASS